MQHVEAAVRRVRVDPRREDVPVPASEPRHLREVKGKDGVMSG